MTKNENIQKWDEFLRFFTQQNAGRATRLAVFERHGENVMDYWLESGLPFLAAAIDSHKDRANIQISLGGFSHEIVDAVELKFIFSRAGDEDGLDVADTQGRTTILRFQSVPQTT